ncbi:MAG: hypothetical protein K5851_00940 [Lachnospiraceae bacterium]|nr:hypothetical protein [Lachnospiraceae bacterium]
MKKTAKNILFFVILALLLVLPGTMMTSKFMERNHLANGKNGVHAKLACEHKNSLDVIVIGDSESYTSVSPMQIWKDYGFTTYAAGQPGAKLTESKSVLRTALKNQKPKVVMLETNNLFRFEAKKNETQDFISRKIYKSLPLLKEHNVWKSPFMELRGKTFKGFSISTKVKPYKGGDYMVRTSKRMKIEQTNIDTLHDIEEMCRENGAQLVLYSAPSPKNYNYKKHNALVALSKKEGLKYVDLNMKLDELNIDWSKDTRDKGDHLNCSGAEKTTAYIGKYLVKNFNLGFTQDRTTALRWDKLLNNYDKRFDKAKFKVEENKNNKEVAFLSKLKDFYK